MLNKPVRQLFEAEPDVFQADFLADNVKWQCRKPLVQRAHCEAQDGAITHTRVENPQGRRFRLQMIEFDYSALRDLPLLVTGIDEREVLLAVVVKTERAICGYQHPFS